MEDKANGGWKGWIAKIRSDPIPVLAFLTSILLALVVFFTTLSAWQYRNIVDFAQTQKELMQKEWAEYIENKKLEWIDRTDMLTYEQYSQAIDRYTVKLAEGDLGKRAKAIWFLLDVLKEVKNNYPDLFDRIVSDYSGAIPYLRLDICPEEFTDSYRGKVWIWVILLESGNAFIKDEILHEIERESSLTPKLLEKIYKVNVDEVPERNKEEFRESIERLKKHIQSLITKLRDDRNTSKI